MQLNAFLSSVRQAGGRSGSREAYSSVTNAAGAATYSGRMSTCGDKVRSRLARVGVVLAVLGAPSLGAAPAQAAPAPQISAESEQILASMLTAVAEVPDTDAGARSDAVSRQFLGTPYGAHTLIGSDTEPEQLVVDLQQVDCFTYADYVEALKRSDDRDEFLARLVDVRYKSGDVSFESRKHFFTDWAASAPAVATDVTASLSDAAVETEKNLNAKDSGGVYLPGLPVVPRTVTYIPSDQVDSGVLDRLRTGDYVGAFARDGGLDVTHVGIYIDGPDGPVFRNASSLTSQNRVIDSPLTDYLETVPGIVVLRPVV